MRIINNSLSNLLHLYTIENLERGNFKGNGSSHLKSVAFSFATDFRGFKQIFFNGPRTTDHFPLH